MNIKGVKKIWKKKRFPANNRILFILKKLFKMKMHGISRQYFLNTKKIYQCFSFFICDTSSVITNYLFMMLIPWLSNPKNRLKIRILSTFYQSVCVFLRKWETVRFLNIWKGIANFGIFKNIPVNFMHLRMRMTSWMHHKTANFKLWIKLIYKNCSWRDVTLSLKYNDSLLNGGLNLVLRGVLIYAGHSYGHF